MKSTTSSRLLSNMAVSFLIILTFLIANTTSWSQIPGVKYNSPYKASNGQVISEGDTILFGKGTGTVGTFKYIQIPADPARKVKQSFLAPGWKGAKAPVKYINEIQAMGGSNNYIAIVALGAFQYTVDIEQALKATEISILPKKTPSVAANNGEPLSQKDPKLGPASTSATPWKSDLQTHDLPKSNGVMAPSLDIWEFIAHYTPNETDPFPYASWQKTRAQQGLRAVSQDQSNPQNQSMLSSAFIAANGKLLIGGNEAWDINWSGVSQGIHTIALSSKLSKELEFPIEFDDLFSSQTKNVVWHKKDPKSNASEDTYYAECKWPGKRSVWMKVTRTCSTPGCGVSIIVYFNPGAVPVDPFDSDEGEYVECADDPTYSRKVNHIFKCHLTDLTAAERTAFAAIIQADFNPEPGEYFEENVGYLDAMSFNFFDFNKDGRDEVIETEYTGGTAGNSMRIFSRTDKGQWSIIWEGYGSAFELKKAKVGEWPDFITGGGMNHVGMYGFKNGKYQWIKAVTPAEQEKPKPEFEFVLFR